MKKLWAVWLAGWMVMAGWGCAKHNPLGPLADSATAKPVAGADLVPYNPAYLYLKTWGSYGTADNQFLDPVGMTLNTDGNLLIADYFLYCLKLFTPDGAFIRKINTTYGPLGVAASPVNGNIYVPVLVPNFPSTIYKLRVYNSSGALLAIWPKSGSGYALNEPRGLMVSGNRLYVCDGGNHRVLVLNATDGSLLETWQNPDPAGGATFKPQAIAMDPDRSCVYVADAYNRVLKLSPSGQLLASFKSADYLRGRWNYPQGIAVDRTGNVYVADTGNCRLLKLNSSGVILRVWGTQGVANGQFKIPLAVTVDAAGKVYVCDELRRDVQVFIPYGISH